MISCVGHGRNSYLVPNDSYHPSRELCTRFKYIPGDNCENKVAYSILRIEFLKTYSLNGGLKTSLIESQRQYPSIVALLWKDIEKLTAGWDLFHFESKVRERTPTCMAALKTFDKNDYHRCVYINLLWLSTARHSTYKALLTSTPIFTTTR